MTKKSNAQGPDSFSRRQFIESIGAAGALGMIGPSLMSFGAMAAEAGSGEVMTASHWGIFHAKVAGGRVVGYRPWEKDLFPSAQLKGVVDSIYSASRIKYPMVRRAYLEKGPGADPASRGTGDFVRVSWDQALDLVAKEVQRVGPAGSFAGAHGWKSTGKLHNCRTLLRRMMNLNGGAVVHTGDYSTGADQIIMPHVVGSLEVYAQQTVWPVIVEKSELVVFWGTDPMLSNQVGLVVPDHGGFAGLKALKESGKKVICIDPERTETCTYLNAQWLAPRPQTDVAMMLGIAHTLVAEKLHNTKFLAEYTTGFDKFLPYLMGETDKTPKTAEWAAAICGIPANVIKELARRFAKNRTLLASGYSLQRQQHGEQVHWMLITLASMLGQIGLPGGGFGLSYHFWNGGTPHADSPRMSGIAEGAKPAWPAANVSATIPAARLVDALLNPGKPFDFNGKTANYPDLKLIYWVGGNPFAAHQNRNHMIKAFEKVETFIVNDFQWTASARYADIVLPVTTAYERNDIEHVGDYSMRAIVAMKKVVEPMFEARNDYDIFAGIAQRLGKEKEFTEGKSEMDWLRSIYDVALPQAKTKKLEMPDFDAFWNGPGYVEFPVSADGKSFVRYAKFRADPVLNPLGTPSGRIEIFSRNIEKMGYADCPPHPTWMEPVERLGGPGAKFPLHIASNHPKGRLHSQLCGTVMRDTYAVAGREPCLINSKDAKARGIKDGDVVRVFNDRGQILAGAKVTDSIRPGVIRISEGGWYDPVDPGKPGSLCRYGDVNVLTLDIGTSKLAQGCCALTAIGDVEKYKGQAPKTMVFTAPKGA